MNRIRGFTLIEMIMALSIMSAVIVGTAALLDRYAADTKNAVAAQHMTTIGQAAQSYIKDNYSAVSAAATDTTPALIRVSTLAGAGYLSSGFSASNAFSQNVCVLVLEPTAGQLAALVVAETGTAIDDLSLGRIAGLMGAAGGGIYSSAPTTLRGAMGGWSTSVGNFANANNLGLRCDGSTGNVAIQAGHPIMAVWFAGGDVSAGFLYRDAVPGRPELNRMNTALDMNNNAINNAATIALNTVVTAGLPCARTGVVARDASGAVMSCQGGTWRAQGSAFWKDPVANFASLPAGDAIGAVRLTLDTSRAFAWNGAKWVPLALDQNGNLAANTFYPSGQASPGASCAGYQQGTIIKDAAGALLTCQSGTWQSATSIPVNPYFRRVNNWQRQNTSPRCGWGDDYAYFQIDDNQTPYIYYGRNGYDGWGPVAGVTWSFDHYTWNGGCSMRYYVDVAQQVVANLELRAGSGVYANAMGWRGRYYVQNTGGWGIIQPSYAYCDRGGFWSGSDQSTYYDAYCVLYPY